MTEKLSAILGTVPKTWDVASLEDLATFITKGGTPTTYGHAWASAADGVPFFRSECVTDAGLLEKGMNYISDAAHQLMQRSEVRSGDLLMTITGNIGRVARVPEKFTRANINQHIARIRVESKANTNYIYQALKHEGYAKHYAAILTGQAYPQISLQQVRETPVALPTLPEQQKIAAILTAVDDKLDVIARQISATQTLKQGLMQTLFTRGAGTPDAQGRWHPHTKFQGTELGRIPVGWSVKPIGSVAKESRARNAAQLDDRLLSGVSKEHGLVPMRDRVKGVSTDRCRVVVPDAFAYNPMRINIGSIARNLHDHSVMVSPDYVVFSTIPEQLLAEYLDHFRRSDVWRSFVGRSGDGGVRIRIYFADLARLRLAVPPLQEQQRIVEVLDGVNDKLSTLTTKQTHYQSLKRGLMQKLLTGEWRV